MEPITFYKARRYRLHPTPDQVARLENWSNCLIALWNDGVRAVEQNRRLFRMGCHKPSMPGRGHVWRIWQETKKAHPGSDFARLPADVVGALSANFDDAVNGLYQGNGRPRFKHSERGLPGLEFPVWKKPTATKDFCSIVLGRDTVKFPNPGNRKELGLGRVAYDRRQKLKGKPKTATIIKDGAFWYLSVACEIEAVQRTSPDTVVGVDLGVAKHVATSDGQTLDFLPAPTRQKLTARMTKAQREVSRAKRGSNRRRKAVARLQRAHAQIANARKTAQHTVARRLVERYGTIVVEKLAVRNMTRSAKGDAEAPGRNVKAKAGLNREILSVAPFAFRAALETKAARMTGRIIMVDPRHTSQTCSACGSVSAENRRSQARFECVACGFADNADFNAARNILARGTSGEIVSRRKAPSGARPEMARVGNAKSSSLGRSRPEGTDKTHDHERRKPRMSKALKGGAAP